MSKWRPIESVPKTCKESMWGGPRVWLTDGRSVVFGKYNEDAHAKTPRPYFDIMDWYGKAASRAFKPTMWMEFEIPELPS